VEGTAGTGGSPLNQLIAIGQLQGERQS